MLSGAWIIIVFASYATALGLELAHFQWRFAGRRAALVTATLVGLAAQTIDLARHAAIVDAAPLSSPAEWLYMAAAVLALVYLAAIFYLPGTPIGILMLPLVLGLVATALRASHEPSSPARTSFFWGSLHGVALLLGTVAVCVGFWAGMMYLIQSYALKHAKSLAARFRLPSLEWLERINSRSLGISLLLIAIGFGSGIVLSAITRRAGGEQTLFADPVVISSAAMLAWLVAAEIFRWVYPAARQGRKVAYLTLASFVFLAITVISFALVDRVHGRGGPAPSASGQPSNTASS
jgi:ABC-type uncharacterized transport system permease subunit